MASCQTPNGICLTVTQVQMTVTMNPTAGAPSPTQTVPSDGGNDTKNSSLYLFTFLTTLLLLLAVSCGIVLRSFILRRRFRRRVEAAIAAGVLLPEQIEALRRRGPVIGDKPQLYEVFIENQKAGFEPSSHMEQGKSLTLDDWANIMPVSAAIIPSGQPRTPAPVPAPAPVYSAAPLNPRRRLWWLRGPDTTPTPILPISAPPPPPGTVPTPDGAPSTPPPAAPTAANSDLLQLTVLIAMPNPNMPLYRPADETNKDAPAAAAEPKEEADGDEHATAPPKGKEAASTNDGDDEEEIPEVVFGVTEVVWAGGANWKPTADEVQESKKMDKE